VLCLISTALTADPTGRSATDTSDPSDSDLTEYVEYGEVPECRPRVQPLFEHEIVVGGAAVDEAQEGLIFLIVQDPLYEGHHRSQAGTSSHQNEALILSNIHKR
jgi:hypothetical protein